MTDDEIAKKIAQECGVIVFLQLIGQREKALVFVRHVLMVIYTNRESVARWMATRKNLK